MKYNKTQADITAPVAVEDISLDWLAATIAPHGVGGSLRSIETQDVMAGTATKIRVGLNWAAFEGGPRSLIVKGGFGAHREAMSYLYAHEARFYSRLSAVLGIRTPACYGVHSDPARHQHIVLLEDLDLAGARFCRVQQPIGEDEARSFLDVLARLHAVYWNADEFEQGGALSDIAHWDALPNGPLGDYARGQLKDEVWRRYMALPRALAVPRLFHDRDRMEAALEGLNAFGRERPWCLLHADFHLGNLYFTADGQPGVLDWQSWSRGHWSHDVTYFLVSALDPVDRRRCAGGLLAHYLGRLAECGVSHPPTLAEAEEAFRMQIVDGLFYWMVNPPEWQSEENNCAVAPRFALAALDYNAFDDI